MDINKHLKKMGIARKDICAEAGISKQHLSEVIAGRRAPGAEMTKQLARAMKLRPHDLRPDWGAVFSDDNDT